MTMKIRIIGAIDEHLLCYCGHEWEDHHHGVVMNPEYFDYPLTIRGCIAQECEYNQRYGVYTPKKGEKPCKCPNFKPRSHSAIKAVKEWQKKQDEKRKANGRQ